LVVALPRLVHDVYGAGVWLLGAVGTAIAAGRIGAAFLVGQFQLRRRGVIAFCADIMAALAILAFVLPVGHSMHLPIALVAGVCFGLGGGTFQTIWVTLLHELVPNHLLGRVASIDLLGSFCLQPIGFTVAGLVTDQVSPVWVFVGAGTLNLLLYSAPLCLRSIRHID
jgi:MFS family permease